jgi:hypothetical protein
VPGVDKSAAACGTLGVGGLSSVFPAYAALILPFHMKKFMLDLGGLEGAVQSLGSRCVDCSAARHRKIGILTGETKFNIIYFAKGY